MDVATRSADEALFKHGVFLFLQELIAYAVSAIDKSLKACPELERDFGQFRGQSRPYRIAGANIKGTRDSPDKVLRDVIVPGEPELFVEPTTPTTAFVLYHGVEVVRMAKSLEQLSALCISSPDSRVAKERSAGKQ